MFGPPGILKQGADEAKGDNARLQAFVGAIAIGDLVKSTLGPKGMDKILQPMPTQDGRIGQTTVTNDGATILKNVWIDNPAAKILIDISKTQDNECGDGTTSVVVLAAEMLRNAQYLVEQKMHPQVVIKGYRLAVAAAREKLEALAMDHGSDAAAFREDLLKIAKTTLSSKLLKHEKDHYAELAVSAVLRLKGKPNLDYIQVIKKAGGSLKDSFLEEGFILEKKIGVGMPKVLENCKVCVANCQMDTDKIKIYGARVKVDSFEAVAEIEAAEKEKMKAKVDKIAAHGCNVFINRQLIYNYPEQLFKERNVMAIEHSDFDGTERLAAVLGSDIISTFDNPEETKLGFCQKIEEIMIGEDKVIKFSGCAQNEACSIVLRGASTHILDEAERSLHDALAVLYQTVQDSRVVYGGGSMECAMAQAIQNKMASVEGKEALAMEQFAKALQTIPAIMADNGGYDSAELLGALRAAHARGETSMGLNFLTAAVSDMSDIGIMESFRSKMSQLCAAAEAAEMIIRVDDIIRNAPRQREGM
jgi:T-complex protein 1 subunit beta